MVKWWENITQNTFMYIKFQRKNEQNNEQKRT